MTDLPRDPFTTAQTILAVVAAGFAAAEVSLPARQEVIAGPLGAWDSDLLSVALPSIYPGLIGGQTGAVVNWQQAVLTGVFTVQLVRRAVATLGNSPRRTLPTAAKVTTDGQTYMRDARVLAHTLLAAVRTNAIGDKGTVRFGGVTGVEPQGDLLGLVGQIEVLLV